MTRALDLYGWAIQAAERGWYVIPLVPGGKRPAFPNHPAARCDRTDRWCRDGHTGWEPRATTDPNRILRAWDRTPYNVGIACGPSRLVVIDLDQPKTPDDTAPAGWAEQDVRCGLDVLILLAHTAGQLPPLDTYTVTTPTGGTHLYFQAPPGIELRNTEGETGNGLGWKVDTRGHGGLIVAAGSFTTAGRYEITDCRDPAPLPGWLVGALTPAPPPAIPSAVVLPSRTRHGRYLAGALAAEVARVQGAGKGQRNHALFVAATALGQLVAGGALTEPYVREVLTQAAARHLATGAYTTRQAEATITSGLTVGARRPRQVAA